MSNFKQIRIRLLLSNLLVFAIVLTGFAVAVRFVFVRNLRQQLTNQLVTLGLGAAAGAELEDGEIELETNFSEGALEEQDQTLQVFDVQGRLLEQRGEPMRTLRFSPTLTVQVQTQARSVQAVTLPVFDNEDEQLIGYIRVSQSLEELNETINELDWGFGFGAFVGLLLYAIGGSWLNRQVMQPIEESYERLKQFTADASHELRSPLMAVSTNAEVALTYAQGMRATDEEKFRAIASAANQMSQLTEDLLLLARTGQVADFEYQTIDLTALLVDLVRLYQPQAEAKEIELKLEARNHLELVGDEAKLIRAFTNLIQNALQYTLPGGKVEIIGVALNREIQVTVADTGIGIASEDLNKVFERLWRGDSSRSYAQGGSGLGLAIAQAIIRQHGGGITVTSQVGIGSCFQVCLPASS
ncbi:MAG: ATP-binding protein [Coleofasciculus sp. D1-CHI-01]|uniref:sensor histidine kinase n=1 Tax=Coleofasciculus sp. D1-CHI-01 TaxID=3068482 RepID=UPI0032FE91E5